MKPHILLAALPFITLGLASLAHAAPDAVVSQDGSGQFTTVQDAINHAPQTTSSDKPWTVLVKPGTYQERVYIQREKKFIRLIGEDAAKTTITYHLYASMKGPDGLDIGTFRTPTVQIDADDFTVENITLENNAGPVGQALALRVDGDRAAFRKCRFVGFQDTILLNRGRQYFSDCTIIGAVDFIFGGATAFFDHCTIECVRDGYITAASTPQEQPFGFVFADCTIQIPNPKTQMYLGRPWRPFASTTFIRTSMPQGIRPEGWHNWKDPEREKTARYAEALCTGPGATTDKRVPWSHQLTKSNTDGITAEKVLSGHDAWKPSAH